MSENYFLSRRSCRNFSTEKISDTELEDIIRKAVKAPTCGNMQLYTIIATREQESLKELSKLHYNQPAASTSPLILTICADFNRVTKWCEINNADAGYDNFHSFLNAMTDAVILAQQIVTIAELEGFGSCYLGTVVYNAKEISQLLNLPELVVPVASVALGIPEAEGEKTDRLPVEAVLNYEKYTERDDNEIKEIFKVHDENPDNQKFVKENGKDNLAQVFAEIRYPGALNRELSKKFIDLLKDKKFLS